MRIHRRIRWCSLGWLAATRLSAAAPDIESWADPQLHRPGVEFGAEAERERATDDARGVGWDSTDAYTAACALLPRIGDVDVEVERVGLALSRPLRLLPGETVARMAYTEASIGARAVSDQDAFGAGLDLVDDAVGAGRPRDAIDAYASAFWHHDPRERTSWMIYVLAGNREYLPQLRVLPGIAFCARSDDLAVEAGLPLAAVTWRPERWFRLEAAIADGAKADVAFVAGDASAILSCEWDRRFFHVRNGSASDPARLDEVAFCLEANIAFATSGRAYARGQWSPLRRLRDENHGSSASLGAATGAAVGLEIDL